MQYSGTIQQSTQSRSGKSIKLTIDGQDYNTKDISLQHCVGQLIMFDVEQKEWQGKYYNWITQYRLPGGEQQPTPPPIGTTTPSRLGQTPTRPPQQADQPKPAAVGPRDLLPITSNIVAHAIAAGNIKSIDELKSWIRAAYTGTEDAINRTGQDDDIPF